LLGGVCCAINQAKNRSGRDGFFIGALLGPVGLIIVLCLPKLAKVSTPAGWYALPGGVERYWDGQAWSSAPAPSAQKAVRRGDEA
jgi:hypothetical protein